MVALPASQGESCLSVRGCGRSTHPSVTAAAAATSHFQRCRAKARTEGPNSGGGVVATTGAMGGVSDASTARNRASGASGANPLAASPAAAEMRRRSPRESASERAGSATT